MTVVPSPAAEYRWTTVVRPRRRWRRGRWRSEIQEDLESLISLVDDGPNPTYLVGGLGLAIRHDGFYRNHADIDLAVFMDDLPGFVSFIKDRGYDLGVARFGMALTPGHRLDVVCPVPVTDAMQDPDGMALRIYRRGPGLAHLRRRTDFMDLLLMTGRDDHVTMHCYGTSVPLADFLPARPVTGSRQLLLPNLNYKQHLPSGWRRQRRDLERLGLTANG